MSKINKWLTTYVVQGYYGQGWEDVTEEITFYGGKERVREYRKNDNHPYRLIQRKVPNVTGITKEQIEEEESKYIRQRLEKKGY